MSDTDAGRFPGPERDFVGYGPEPPRVRWPGGALVAVNLVVNHEEGGEYSLADDGVNDTWGEYSFQYGPDIRDLLLGAVHIDRSVDRAKGSLCEVERMNARCDVERGNDVVSRKAAVV